MTDIEKEEKKRKDLSSLRDSFTQSDEKLAFFYECLGDESWRVRKDAVELAVSYPTENVIRKLIDGLSSEENAGLRNASQEALTLIGTPAIPLLKRHYMNADEDVRKFILDILGDIRDTCACDFLINALSDPSENVVIAASENIGKLKCNNAIAPLLKLLNPEKQWLSFVIIESLAQIGSPFDAKSLLPLFEIPQMRKPLLDLIPLINTPYNIILLKNAFLVGSNFIKINAARKLFTEFERSPKDLPNIKKDIKDHISYNEIYEKLLDPEANESKIFALLAYITESISFLTSLIEKGNDESLEFFGNLVHYAPFENVFHIKNMLDRYDGKNQAYIAYLCGIFSISETKERLITLCNSSFGHTRQAVAFSLGKLGGEDAKNCLYKLLNDPYPDVRQQAVSSLSSLLTKDNFPYELAEDIFNKGEKDVLLSLLDLLNKTNALKEEHLIKALRSPYAEVREMAIKIIGITNRKEFVNELLMQLTDESDIVRLSVVEALGFIGNDSCVETLSKFLSHEDIQIKKTAIESIYKISPQLLKKYENEIFKDISPFAFFGLLTLLENGINLSPELFIQKALFFDDKDIFIELINFFSYMNLPDAKDALIKIIEKEKGTDYLPEYITKSALRRD